MIRWWRFFGASPLTLRCELHRRRVTLKDGRKRLPEAAHHLFVAPGCHRLARVGAHPLPERRIAEDRINGPRQRRAVTLRYDQAVLAVAKEAARRGPDAVGRDDRHTLVEGFVHHQPPRLLEHR